MIEELFKQFLEHAKTLKAATAFLWRRMGALRLPQVAGSLSYTTVLSLVPLLVIVLSILTILPQFQGFQKEIQNFMTENLMPARMSKVVMQQITTFTERSSRLSLVGGIFLIFSLVFITFKLIKSIFSLSSFKFSVFTSDFFTALIIIFLLFSASSAMILDTANISSVAANV